MIETARLILRPWREDDKPAFDAIINTPAMMKHFGGVAPRERIDTLIDSQIAKQDADGHCMWAVETKADGALAGICGLRLGGHPDTPVDGMYELGFCYDAGRGVPKDYNEAAKWVVKAVASGRLPVARLDEAATRVLALRLFQQRLASR